MPTNYLDNQASTSNTSQTTANKGHAQGMYWIGTISPQLWTPPKSLPKDVSFIRGQLEEGDETGRRHWQVVVGFKKKCRTGAVKAFFGFKKNETRQCHVELTLSAAANAYVMKDETCVDTNLRFDYGDAPMKRNDKTDWAKCKELMKTGRLDDLPPDIYIKHYNVAKRIKLDNLVFKDIVKNVRVYWGVSGSGKSHRAREEAGPNAYIKDPCTKWWDGYRPDEHDCVIIEEFTGTINISHMLRWLDKWGSACEAKQGGVPFYAGNIWITSNVNPLLWYPDANADQVAALMRRMKITHFSEIYKPPAAPKPQTDNAIFWANAPQQSILPIWAPPMAPVPEWEDLKGIDPNDVNDSDDELLHLLNFPDEPLPKKWNRHDCSSSTGPREYGDH